MTSFDELFGDVPLMAILRGVGVERSLELSSKAWDLGIHHVELPVQSPTDLEALRVTCAEGRERGRLVGAGTVISPDQIPAIAEAGAAFTVSPGLDLEVVRASESAGMPSLPGVATPTEIQTAVAAGLTWLKAFPAAQLGTAWFTAMAGPFPQVKFVATGGMDANNAGDFLAAGVRCVAVGSALAHPTQLDRLSLLLGSGGD